MKQNKNMLNPHRFKYLYYIIKLYLISKYIIYFITVDYNIYYII